VPISHILSADFGFFKKPNCRSDNSLAAPADDPE
jgi:hypothetical protein